jgi:hypothetical protein
MKREYIMRLMSGLIMLIGSLLGFFVSKYWLILPGFASLMLIQSSLTGFCPSEKLMEKMKIGE